MPTKKTNGNEVPRSEFLASGPRMCELSGMMEEWRVEHWERMDCWAVEEGVLSSLLVFSSLSLFLVDECLKPIVS